MKIHFKPTWRKRPRIPSRTNLGWCIVHHPRLPTLPSRKQTSLWRPAQQDCTSQDALTYPYLSKPLIYTYIYFSPTSPLLVLSTQKNTTSFSGLPDCLIWTSKYISKLPGEKDHVYHPERILDDTFSTIHGFPPCLVANKPHYCLLYTSPSPRD